MSVFPPDSFIVADVTPSPNFDERKGERPADMILLHYTGMQTGASALERLTTAASKVSAHYVVFEDGRIVQCVPEEKRAWHAGEASWAGETDVNSRSIGIEIVNPGHEFGYSDFRAIKQDEVMSKDLKDVDKGILNELFLDSFDYDDDGVSEIFTYTQAFEGAGFNAYKRKNGKWEKVFEGANYHCAY